MLRISLHREISDFSTNMTFLRYVERLVFYFHGFSFWIWWELIILFPRYTGTYFAEGQKPFLWLRASYTVTNSQLEALGAGRQNWCFGAVTFPAEKPDMISPCHATLYYQIKRGPRTLCEVEMSLSVFWPKTTICSRSRSWGIKGMLFPILAGNFYDGGLIWCFLDEPEIS